MFDNEAIETDTSTVLCNTDGAVEWGRNIEHDVPLAAAAPDLAQTIAAQTWEYGVQWDTDHISWLGTSLPECRRSVEANRENEDLSPSVVRRLVGPAEVTE